MRNFRRNFRFHECPSIYHDKTPDCIRKTDARDWGRKFRPILVTSKERASDRWGVGEESNPTLFVTYHLLTSRDTGI